MAAWSKSNEEDVKEISLALTQWFWNWISHVGKNTFKRDSAHINSETLYVPMQIKTMCI